MSAFLFLPLPSEVFKFPSWASHTEDTPIRYSSHCSVDKDFRFLFSLLGGRTLALPTFYLNARRDSGRASMKEGGLMWSGRPRCISPPLLRFSILPTRFPVFLIVRDTILHRFSLSFRLFLSSSQAEIVKRLSAICAQIIPFLSQEVRVTTHWHSQTWPHVRRLQLLIHTRWQHDKATRNNKQTKHPP